MKSSLTKPMIVVTFITITLISKAQPAHQIKNKELDHFLKIEMQKEHIPGLAYAVLVDGKLIGKGVYGLANVELKSPVNIHTVFPIGSIGKTFTATSIMLLQQTKAEGKYKKLMAIAE